MRAYTRFTWEFTSEDERIYKQISTWKENVFENYFTASNSLMEMVEFFAWKCSKTLDPSVGKIESFHENNKLVKQYFVFMEFQQLLSSKLCGGKPELRWASFLINWISLCYHNRWDMIINCEIFKTWVQGRSNCLSIGSEKKTAQWLRHKKKRLFSEIIHPVRQFINEQIGMKTLSFLFLSNNRIVYTVYIIHIPRANILFRR